MVKRWCLLGLMVNGGYALQGNVMIPALSFSSLSSWL